MYSLFYTLSFLDTAKTANFYELFHQYPAVPNPYAVMRDGPRKQWSDKSMAKAISSVEQQAISIRKAADM